jgi:hypothetical protein
MRSASPHRKIVLVAVLFLLTTAPWASAGPWHGSSGHPAMSSDGIVIPDFLSRAWSLLTGIWTKEGCNIDPNGRCLPSLVISPENSADTGCQIDPGGRCTS